MPEIPTFHEWKAEQVVTDSKASGVLRSYRPRDWYWAEYGRFVLRARRKEWMPIATAPRDGTEVLVIPYGGYDRALFQDGFWFWSTPDADSIAAGPEPKGWKPLPFNAEVRGA